MGEAGLGRKKNEGEWGPGLGVKEEYQEPGTCSWGPRRDSVAEGSPSQGASESPAGLLLTPNPAPIPGYDAHPQL